VADGDVRHPELIVPHEAEVEATFETAE